VDKLTNKLTKAHQEKVDLEYQIDVLETDLVSPGLTTKERVRLLKMVKELRASMADYDRPIHRIEHKLRNAIQQVNRLYTANPYAKNQPIQMPVIKVEARAKQNADK
jgi:hypothetical protein